MLNWSKIKTEVPSAEKQVKKRLAMFEKGDASHVLQIVSDNINLEKGVSFFTAGLH